MMTVFVPGVPLLVPNLLLRNVTGLTLRREHDSFAEAYT